MIEILVMGEIPKPAKYFACCGACNTQFIYQDDDIVWKLSLDLISCPLCGDKRAPDRCPYVGQETKRVEDSRENYLSDNDKRELVKFDEFGFEAGRGTNEW